MMKATAIIIFYFLIHFLNATQLETDFVAVFGNEPNGMGQWQEMRYLYDAGKLREFCLAAHIAGLNETQTIESVTINERQLNFLDPKYQPMRIDVVKYGIDLCGRDPVRNKKYWWFTKGRVPGCVFFLVPVNAQKTEFGLLEYVCNIKYNVTDGGSSESYE